MVESAAAVPSVIRKPPVVDRVMYGIGKFVERHTPMAHADRIIRVINRFIIPKLKPEQVRWVGRHKDAIETAAVVAGVGITATEITIATVFAARMVGHFRAALERVKANRPVRAPAGEPAKNPHTKLKEVAGGKPKGPHVEYGRKKPRVVYDRTNELIMLQEMAADNPLWETPASRALAEGRLVLRENEHVDWDRLGLPDPTKKKVKAGKGLVGPDQRIDSYTYKVKTVPQAPEPVIPDKPGLADAIRDKIEEIWPWSFQNTELRLRRQKFAAQRAFKEKRLADAAKKAKELEEKMLLKKYGPLGPPDTARMKELGAQYEATVAAIRERTRALAQEIEERDLLRRKK